MSRGVVVYKYCPEGLQVKHTFVQGIGWCNQIDACIVQAVYE